MRHCYTARFFRVIVKVRLSIKVGVVADNLDCVFVCADSTVRTESPELTTGCSLGCGVDSLTQFKRVICDIIDDTDGELIFRLIRCEVVEYGNELCRGCIF